VKILYHHRTLSKDGQNVHIEELIAAFRRAGHEVMVVGLAAHKEAAFGSDGGFMSRLRASLPRGIAEVMEFGYSFLAFSKLWRAYRAFKPDALYERYNLFMLAGAWLRAITGIPFIVEINAPLVLERSREPGLSLKRFARFCERYVWRKADLALPVTEVLSRQVQASGVAASHLKVMPNGIDLQHFKADHSGAKIRARYGLENKIVIGFTGFIREWHGLPAVIEVMKELRNGHNIAFLVVGEGPGRKGLEQAAREFGLSVVVTGVVERADIPDHVAAFDIALQPKATEYASPLKAFEYMGLARAIIAPAQLNIREIFTDHENAVLFAPDDLASFSTVLRHLIEDADLRARLGAAAAASIRARDFTWDGNARRIASAIAEMTAGERSIGELRSAPADISP
jgi:glycosyltransferase involved in cell wall biosynthesis